MPGLGASEAGWEHTNEDNKPLSSLRSCSLSVSLFRWNYGHRVIASFISFNCRILSRIWQGLRYSLRLLHCKFLCPYSLRARNGWTIVILCRLITKSAFPGIPSLCICSHLPWSWSQFGLWFLPKLSDLHRWFLMLAASLLSQVSKNLTEILRFYEETAL